MLTSIPPGTIVTTIRVGPSSSPKDFTVHVNLLTRSSFFTNALCNQGVSTSITLDSCTAPTFHLYNNWLYTGRLFSKPTIKDAPAVSAPGSQHRKEWIQLTQAYILGVFLEDVEFRDQVMDALLDWFEEVHFAARSAPLDNVEDVYGELAKGNPLRELVSDIAAYHFEHTLVEEMQKKSDMPAAFLLETLVKMSTRFQGGRSAFGTASPVLKGKGGCKYHCHGEGGCYKR
ncbi:hypothetical protein CC80DRAFT_588771 [Byssothecium circinans]|uniref:BTB domain-containing protein n=1 Tax=Byssothecium circinans TaxID=147558 RepID=A0A6A5UB83_9PLEO|nr:hypothetical protein CC80DRAFT_588771 [Byssothecium circinans]